MIREKFNNAIQSYTAPSDILAVAVSGGADSMCLLHLCLNSPFIKQENLLVISIDHKIRGEKSGGDLDFVKAYCKKHGVRFFPFTVDIPALCQKSGRGAELEAREARGEIFENIVTSHKADKVLTGHHASDNAESILMHIFRGCGLNGLCGMKAFSRGYLLRPLLEAEKSEIDAYITENKIPFVTDETNADSRYTRNFIRNEVLPLVKQKYPGVEIALCRLGKNAGMVCESIARTVRLDFPDENGCVKIDMRDGTPPPEFLNRIMLALSELGELQNIGSKHYLSIIKLVSAENGCGVDLPGGVRVVREYGHITFYRKEQTGGKFLEPPILFETGRTEFGKKIIEILARKKMPSAREADVLYFDADKIPDTAVFRFRRDGDLFCPFGGGTKKLKEYLIDKKIPARLRGGLILIADGKEVLAIAGVEISDKIKISTGSTGICSLRILKKNLNG